MEKEFFDLNLRQLEKEIRLLELPAGSLEPLSARLQHSAGENFSLAFETSVVRIPVKGDILLTSNAASGLYGIVSYGLSLAGDPAPGRGKYIFPCDPWLIIRLDEAVNLIQGRFVHRKPEIGAGYWIGLDRSKTMTVDAITFIRSDFEVREYLAETGLGGWLGLNGWVRLVDQLERGYRCDLATGDGPDMRMVKLEADPFDRRLKVTDRKGNEIKVKI